MSVGVIPYEFIRQRTELCWNDLKFGLNCQMLSPAAAIEKAIDQLSAQGEPPPEVVELAGLTKSDSVAEAVLRLAETEKAPAAEFVKAKWLYLALAWLYENRKELADPLKLVEEVYSDFDYPKEVAPFVRYMPMQGPDLGNREQNEARMFDYWKLYVDAAAKRFASSQQADGCG